MKEANSINEIFSQLKKGSELKECFHHKKEECSGGIINAHSISRSGRLDLIKGLVNKNDKVYSLSEVIINNTSARKGIKDVGWGKTASTFFGFCHHHDDKLFKPIEDNNTFDNSIEHCFLHSYRSFSYSYHKLKETYRLLYYALEKPRLTSIQNSICNLSNIIKPLKATLSNLPPNFEIPQELLKSQMEELQNKITSLENGVQGTIGNYFEVELLPSLQNIRLTNDLTAFFTKLMETLFLWNNKFKNILDEYEKINIPENRFWINWMGRYKSKLDKSIENKTYDDLIYYCVVKNELYPLASAFAFSPDFLYSEIDNFIIAPSNPENILNTCLMVTILPDKANRTIVLFACFKEDMQSQHFLNKLFSLNNVDEFDKAVTSIIINKSSNTFINPLLWDKLGDRQTTLLNEINIKRPFDTLPEKPFLSEINFFDSEFSAKNLGLL